VAARTNSYSQEAVLSLALAVVAASPAPLLLLDGEFDILGVSDSFAQVYSSDTASWRGRRLWDVGEGEWDLPELRALLGAAVSDPAHPKVREMVLRPAGRDTRRLIIHVERLAYLYGESPRLLLGVADVSELRAYEKAKAQGVPHETVLLKEVRHRVANSLQIIASLLLHNARKTQSEETRAHLKDAHHRVMSVAALEKQLVHSSDEDVELRLYLASLCDSISTAMIGDDDKITLAVTGGGVVDARVSVSLGLIVTELVINALKHAFPDGREGRVVIDFQSHGPNWILSVTDDGVGMPVDPHPQSHGLGSSIVEALAKQLEATVEASPPGPGARVVITHTQIALIDAPAEPAVANPAAPSAA
jgi:two-component sensor histidine kinase